MTDRPRTLIGLLHDQEFQLSLVIILVFLIACIGVSCHFKISITSTPTTTSMAR